MMPHRYRHTSPPYSPECNGLAISLFFRLLTLSLSSAASSSFINSCLFLHTTWLSANSGVNLSAGGTGSVILVIRYYRYYRQLHPPVKYKTKQKIVFFSSFFLHTAVLASAIP